MSPLPELAELSREALVAELFGRVSELSGLVATLRDENARLRTRARAIESIFGNRNVIGWPEFYAGARVAVRRQSSTILR